MRRLVAIPIKTSAVAVILLAGVVYVAADVRQAAARRQQHELGKELSTQQSAVSPAAGPQLQNQSTQNQKTDDKAQRQQNDEVAAERQAAQLPAQKPAKKSSDGHTRQIVISIADRQLALLEDGQVVKTYPIAVGARVSPSPDGDFVIINRAKDPAYNNKGTIVEPGRNNPLGSRWMGLSAKGYGIHGTNAPSSIGKAASHGCFRMGKKDVEDLYSRVKVGDTVVVRRQRDAMIARVFSHDAAPVTNAAAEVQVAAATTPAGTTATEATER